MKVEKLKEVLESPVTKSIIVGSASAGAYTAGCMAMSTFKNVPILRTFCEAVTIPTGILVGALAYLELANIELEGEAKKEPEAESDMVETFEI